MANHESRCGQLGTRLSEMGADLRLILADGQVDACERAELHALEADLAACADTAEDVGYDIAQACQTLRIGRDRAPDRHLRQKIVLLDEVRARRAKRLTVVRTP